jgi:hypothetical protein
MPGISRPAATVYTDNSAPSLYYFRRADGTRYYGGELTNNGGGVPLVAIPANDARIAPVFLGRANLLDDAAVYFSGGTQTFRLALYANNSVEAPYPTSLIWQSPVLSSGVAAVVSSPVNIRTRGSSLFWSAYLATAGTGTPACYPTASGSNLPPIFGHAAAGAPFGGPARTGLQIAMAFGAFPATFPAGATPVVTSVIPVPIVAFTLLP